MLLIDNTTPALFSNAWVSLKPNILTIQTYTTSSQSHLELDLLLLRPLLLFPQRKNVSSLHKSDKPVVDHFSHENQYRSHNSGNSASPAGNC